MRLVKLTAATGLPLYINPVQVVAVSVMGAADPAVTYVWCTDGAGPFQSREPVDYVVDKLQGYAVEDGDDPPQ